MQRVPGCGVRGSLNYEERTYGLFFYCTRSEEDKCSYTAEQMSVREDI
jgi:hypothetical protein